MERAPHRKSAGENLIRSFQVEGIELKKVRTNSRVYQRYYLLDAGLQALCWEPSKKESDKARISLASIREVSVLRKQSLNRNKSDAVGVLSDRAGKLAPCRPAV